MKIKWFNIFGHLYTFVPVSYRVSSIVDNVVDGPYDEGYWEQIKGAMDRGLERQPKELR